MSPEQVHNAGILELEILELDKDSLGLMILKEGLEPTVDIVAVHGLNGHRQKTWTTSNGVLWLRDLLPEKIPYARIFSWGYDAKTHSGSHTSTQFIYDHAISLVSDLCLERQLTQTERRPIIFISHSLGGLVVKSALIHSNSANSHHLAHHRAIKLCTYGVFFLGTPHQGGEGVAWGERILTVASVFVKTNSRVLDNLRVNSEWLQQQLEQYNAISSDFVTKFAYEVYPTSLPIGTSLLVVPKSSAVVPGATIAEPIAIMANHLEMTKYPSKDDEGYRKVSGHLLLMMAWATAKIADNWEREDISRHAPKLDSLQKSAPQALEGFHHQDLTGCIERLSFFGSDTQHESILPPHAGTFKWLDTVQGWEYWIKYGDGIFWIQGKPGSGKSTLIKHLVGLASSKSNEGLGRKFAFIIAAFYNSRGSLLAKTFEGFLRTVIVQILRQNPDSFSHISSLYLEATKTDEVLESNLQRMLLTLVEKDSAFTNALFFVDAVDECAGPLRAQLEFLEELVKTCRQQGRCLHICMSGRSSPTLLFWLKEHSKIVLEE